MLQELHYITVWLKRSEVMEGFLPNVIQTQANLAALFVKNYQDFIHKKYISL
jgi:hypothetical protein